jgi:hypothetical protein
VGTSISHPSPNTPGWKAASETYLSKAFPLERVIQEVWRAATNQPSGNLKEDLSKPIISQCLKCVLSASSAQEVYHNVSRTIAYSGSSNLATDIAKIAAVNSLLRIGDRTSNFVKLLFSESIDYLISRDIPGMVGNGDRLRNVTDSIELKKSVKEKSERIIGEHLVPKGIEENPQRWKDYVEEMVLYLSGKH